MALPPVPSAAPGAAGRRKPWPESLGLAVVALVVIVVGWVYLHDARVAGRNLTSVPPPSYFGLLTEALLNGQTHLNVGVDPLLLTLANPYAGPQGANRPHDMSFYRGKFYLYYGATPAVVLMMPWKLLTGSYLTEIAATATFCFGGFACAVWWLWRLRARFFPSVSPGWTVLALLVLGFGSPTFFLSNNTTFYAVPISAAFFCLMAAVLLVDTCLRSQSRGRAMAFLAGASLMHGFAVGARPDYVLGLATLLLPAGWWWRRRVSNDRNGWENAPLLPWAAAILPAALIGTAIATYNHLRFDSPFEFGIQYSMASTDIRGAHLMGLDFIEKNLRLYLLHPADFMRYFPFFHAGGRPFGILPHFTLTALAIFFPLTWLRSAWRRDPAWTIGGSVLLGTALANLGVLCLFFGGEDRYLIDFAPPALLLACGVLLAMVESRAGPRLVRWISRGALAALAIWTLGNGTAHALSQRASTPLYAAIESVANTVVYRFEQLTGSKQGPLELTLTFPQDAVGRRDPLLTTGNLTRTGDIVYVFYPDAQHVQFGFFHLGAGGPVSEPIPVDFTREHVVGVQLGSLYPPRHHPSLAGWTDEQAAALRRRLEITLDGKTVLKASVNVYASTPDGVYVGRNPLAGDVSGPSFSGTIRSQRRLGVPAVDPQPPSSLSGPVRMHLRIPNIPGSPPQPLVCTGRTGAGDVLHVQVLTDGRLRFGHDSWGSGEILSEPVAIDFDRSHLVEVEMGSLYPAAAQPGLSEDLRRRLAVRLNGTTVLSAVRPFNPSTADEVVLGQNAIGASSAVGMFTGTILSSGRGDDLAQPPAVENWGPVHLSLRLPAEPGGRSEPLVVTGVPGAADIVYVNYSSPGKVRFGHDHWGSENALSPEIPWDYSQFHSVEISLGSLYPSPDHPGWQNRPAEESTRRRQIFEVKIDGTVVFSVPRPAYPAGNTGVTIGRNAVGSTSSDRLFRGDIRTLNRSAW